jgi:hypothetical protein
MVLPFFPAELIELVAGPERAKNLAGKYPPPDQIRFLMMVGFALWVYGTLVVHPATDAKHAFS